VAAALRRARPGSASLGVLEIAFGDGVQVFINDEYRGTTPMKTLQLKPDVYHLTYKKNGMEVGREDIIVRAGMTARSTIQEPAGKLVLIVVPASGVQLKLDGKVFGAAPESLDVSPGVHELEFSADGYSNVNLTLAAESGRRTMVPVLMKPVSAAAESKPQKLPPPSLLASNQQDNAPPVTTGNIRWNPGLVEVDIYENDRRLGSTPMTLDLPAGAHMFEYRHEGLKKTATFNVQPGSTTTTVVTFEITVTINVKPFANVFLVEDSRVPLGETPLNKVTVPVGGTLAFQYSNLPEKNYHITAKDANGSIYMSFP
jgi:hypothetical protein